MTITRSMFELAGPQLTNAEFGPEPTLEEIIQNYYNYSGIPMNESVKLREQYIQAWLAKNGEAL